MLKRLTVALIATGLLTVGCLMPIEGTDASTGRRDAGSGTDSSGGQDTGGEQTWNTDNYGIVCTSDDQCPGGKCASIFQDSPTKSCFKTCQTGADCSDFPFDVANVQCSQHPAAGLLCLHGSPQNGPCGDVLNSTCIDQTQACAMDSTGFGLCVRGCKTVDASDATLCTAVPQSYCGCSAGQGCSMEMSLVASANDPNPDGVCAATTASGATCGFDSTTYIQLFCTDGLVCTGVTEQNPVGRCDEPPDAGSGTDA